MNNNISMKFLGQDYRLFRTSFLKKEIINKSMFFNRCAYYYKTKRHLIISSQLDWTQHKITEEQTCPWIAFIDENAIFGNNTKSAFVINKNYYNFITPFPPGIKGTLPPVQYTYKNVIELEEDIKKNENNPAMISHFNPIVSLGANQEIADPYAIQNAKDAFSMSIMLIPISVAFTLKINLTNYDSQIYYHQPYISYGATNINGNNKIHPIYIRQYPFDVFKNRAAANCCNLCRRELSNDQIQLNNLFCNKCGITSKNVFKNMRKMVKMIADDKLLLYGLNSEIFFILSHFEMLLQEYNDFLSDYSQCHINNKQNICLEEIQECCLHNIKENHLPIMFHRFATVNSFFLRIDNSIESILNIIDVLEKFGLDELESSFINYPSGFKKKIEAIKTRFQKFYKDDAKSIIDALETESILTDDDIISNFNIIE